MEHVKSEIAEGNKYCIQKRIKRKGILGEKKTNPSNQMEINNGEQHTCTQNKNKKKKKENKTVRAQCCSVYNVQSWHTESCRK